MEQEYVSRKTNLLSAKSRILKESQKTFTKKTFTKKTKKKVNIEQTEKESPERKKEPKIQIFFAMLGKIVRVISKTKNLIKYRNIHNLSPNQLDLLGDKGSFYISELKGHSRKKGVDKVLLFFQFLKMEFTDLLKGIIKFT